MPETASNIGYGQQTPLDSNDRVNAVAFMIRQMVAQLDTMKLVQVVEVHGGGIEGGGTVDVHPLVNQVDGNGNATPHGTVYGLPWHRLQGGTGAVILDPKAGDIGFVVASDRDISAVKSTKKESNPGTGRRFDISDGVYVGGLLNAAPAQYVWFTDDGIKIVDKSGNTVETSAQGIALTPAGAAGVVILLTPTGAVVTGNLTVTGDMQLGGAIVSEGGGAYPGNFATTGDIVAKSGTPDQVTLTTHVHGGVLAGGSSTAPPTPGS